MSGTSLSVWVVLVHPLDLRLGIFLGYEHSRHAWLAWFVLTHLQGSTEIHFHSANGGLIFRWVYMARGTSCIHRVWALWCRFHCAATALLPLHDKGVSELVSPWSTLLLSHETGGGCIMSYLILSKDLTKSDELIWCVQPTDMADSWKGCSTTSVLLCKHIICLQCPVIIYWSVNLLRI